MQKNGAAASKGFRAVFMRLTGLLNYYQIVGGHFCGDIHA
jgi:hypothetical protein